MRAELKERFMAFESELMGKKYTSLNTAFLILVVLLMCMSYRYVLSPVYLPEESLCGSSGEVYTLLGDYVGTMGDMDMSSDTLIAVDDASYITYSGDGKYTVHNVFGEQDIPEEWAEVLVGSGVEFRQADK